MEVLATDLRYHYPLLFFLQGNSLGEDESPGQCQAALPVIHKAEQALLEVSVQADSVLAKQDPRGYSLPAQSGNNTTAHLFRSPGGQAFSAHYLI